MEDGLLLWAVGAVAVILIGLSKGGFGGLTIMAVPIMSLVIPPTQAAAIILPIMIIMDGFSLHAYRKIWNPAIIKLMLPASLVGIGAGWALAGTVSDDAIRVSVGLIAVSFSIYSAARLWRGTESTPPSWAHNKWIGRLAAAVSGFTSFFAHAGGPPFRAYVLPRKLENQLFAGTSVIFFAFMNAVKLIPYAALGQLSTANLSTSLFLIPLAPIGVWLGVWGVKRLPMQIFYIIIYSLVFIVGLKLLYDGLL